MYAVMLLYGSIKGTVHKRSFSHYAHPNADGKVGEVL